MDPEVISQMLLKYYSHASCAYRASSSSQLSAYEIQRLENIRRNHEELVALGIEPISALPDRRPPRRAKQPRQPRQPRSQATSIRQSNRQQKRPVPVVSLPPDPPKRRSRVRRLTHPVSSKNWPMLDASYEKNIGCSKRSRLRHALSRTKTYDDIDPSIRKEVLAALPGGQMPASRNGDDIRYKYVSYIVTEAGTWNFRATFGRGDFGSFCEPKLAAFVSNYAIQHPRLTREQVWDNLGIVNIDRAYTDEKFAAVQEAAAVQETSLSTESANANAAVLSADAVDADNELTEYCPMCNSIIDLNGEVVIPSLGCDYPSCGKWVCWRCAGLNTPEDLDKYTGNWFCPFHGTAQDVLDAAADSAVIDDIDIEYCALCTRIIDLEGEVVTPSVGCDYPSCNRWVCWDCAGIGSPEALEQFKGDWFCPLHRPA